MADAKPSVMEMLEELINELEELRDNGQLPNDIYYKLVDMVKTIESRLFKWRLTIAWLADDAAKEADRSECVTCKQALLTVIASTLRDIYNELYSDKRLQGSDS